MLKPTAKLMMLAAALLALLATPAHASGGDVIRDCSEDGKLDHRYTQKELAAALDNLPSDLDEYTDCRTVIRHAQLAGARKGDGKRRGVLGLVDTKAPPTAAEQRKLHEAAGARGPVEIGGKAVTPGTAAALAAGFGGELPGYVLVALLALAAAMLGGGVFAFRRRWPETWQAAGAIAGGQLRRIRDGARRGVSRFRRD